MSRRATRAGARRRARAARRRRHRRSRRDRDAARAKHQRRAQLARVAVVGDDGVGPRLARQARQQRALGAGTLRPVYDLDVESRRRVLGDPAGAASGKPVGARATEEQCAHGAYRAAPCDGGRCCGARRARDWAARPRPDAPLLRDHPTSAVRALARDRHVHSVYATGSAAAGHLRPGRSDVDLVAVVADENPEGELEAAPARPAVPAAPGSVPAGSRHDPGRRVRALRGLPRAASRAGRGARACLRARDVAPPVGPRPARPVPAGSAALLHHGGPRRPRATRRGDVAARGCREAGSALA